MQDIADSYYIYEVLMCKGVKCRVCTLKFAFYAYRLPAFQYLADRVPQIYMLMQYVHFG